MKSGVYAIVAVVAAAAGFVIYRFALAPHIEPAPAMQAQLPAATAEPAETGAPAELPEFSLPDLDGNATSIRHWTGKSMIVNFWATWCAPCRREIPLLRQLQAEQAASGFQVVGVAGDAHDDVVKYAQDIGIDYPILIDADMQAVTQFAAGSIGFPFTVFTDNQDRIVAIHLGELTRPQSEVFIDAVTRVNKGELTPTAARSVVARQLQQLPSAAASTDAAG